jgi:two-component system, chemotaxis family, response regulator Rcp1
MKSDGKALRILLVEDSPGDVRLTLETFRETDASIRIDVAADGVEAMAFLGRAKGYENSCRPDLILLDLNLPRMDGREVLAKIKSDPELRIIPTVILTTSAADADIKTSYQLQANCFLSKPVRLDDFESLVKSIDEFWMVKATLPHTA